MQIYKLTSSQTDLVYVGKTKQTLEKRFQDHKDHYIGWLDGKSEFRSSYFLTEYDDFKIELIEETKNSLREIHWILKLNSCNFEFNSEDYFIYEHKDKCCKQGFRYVFKIMRNRKFIIQKSSIDLEYLKTYRDEFIKNNPEVFIEE